MRREKLEIANGQEIFCKRINWTWDKFITTENGTGALTGACGSSVTIDSILTVKWETRLSAG